MHNKAQRLHCENSVFSADKKNKKIPIGDNFFIQRVRETEKLKRVVDKKGFKNIMLESPLLPYMIDEEIFKI